MRKVQENRAGLKFNQTHQFLIYADGIHLLGESIKTAWKKTEVVLVT
jgi:hypothetical protein